MAIAHAVEVRDESFCVPRLYELLRRHGVALVVADTGGRFPHVDERTAPFVYVRLHGPRELYASQYRSDEIEAWAIRVSDWAAQGRDVYVYFDNDVKAYAPDDALALRTRVAALLGADGKHRAA